MVKLIRRRRKRQRRYGVGALLLLIAALLLCLFIPAPATDGGGSDDDSQPPIAPEQTLQVHFIDVGQGDAALLLCEGQAMLVDGGGVANAAALSAYLRAQGVQHLDYLVASHAHEDHVGGLSGPLATCTVERALAPLDSPATPSFEIFLAELEACRIPLTVIGRGDELTLGGATVSVLAPADGGDGGNDYSLILRVVYGQTAFLLTGDAEYLAERELLDSGAAVSANVLKAGHHGSADATGYRLLREVEPQYAVISCGSGNDYGHPHDQLLSRLHDAGVSIYRTDIQGHIVFVSDGEDLRVSTERELKAGD